MTTYEKIVQIFSIVVFTLGMGMLVYIPLRLLGIL
jgi:hypothetical protein